MNITVQASKTVAKPAVTFPWIGINKTGAILLFLINNRAVCLRGTTEETDLDGDFETTYNTNVIYEHMKIEEQRKFEPYFGEIKIQMKGT